MVDRYTTTKIPITIIGEVDKIPRPERYYSLSSLKPAHQYYFEVLKEKCTNIGRKVRDGLEKITKED